MATWPTITDDDGSNTTGTVANNANVWNPIRDYIGTAWVSPSFNAGDFTASGSMTWTVASGDVVTYKYVEIGKTMIVAVLLTTTTVGGTPSTALKLKIPNGRTATGSVSGLAMGLNNGSSFTGFWQTNGTNIDFYVDATAGTNWTASTNNTQIRTVCTFEIG